jgi:hypothetical protein
MFFKKRPKQTKPAKIYTPLPASAEPETLGETKKRLDHLYHDGCKLADRFQRHLVKDRELIAADAELLLFVHRLGAVTRDFRDAARVTRERFGVRS